MAKAQGKKARRRSYAGPPPRITDAERLAALRWLVMKIEQISIEVFVTDRGKFSQIEDSLRAEVQFLRQIGRPVRPHDDDDCPDGYILCRDGLCAPMCDGMNQAAASGKKGKEKR